MGNVHMEASQINYRGGETKMSVEEALKNTSGEAAAIAALQASVGNLQTGKADLSVIAPEFDAESGVYAIGDLVMYQGKLYEFTTAHETAGEWDDTEVAEKTVSDEVDSLKSGLTNVESKVVYDTGDMSYGNIAVGETKYERITLPAKTGYDLVSANGHLNYADSAIVSCQITDNTALDVYVTNIKSFVLDNQTLYYRLMYVKSSV